MWTVMDSPVRLLTLQASGSWTRVQGADIQLSGL
jgi:hypothetical protein